MRLHLAALLIVALGIQPCGALAQPYPNRAIRLVVPFAPGGITDVLARMVGAELGERLGHAVVIENRPGAGGTIGASLVAKSPPDGYTLLVGAISTIAVSPNLYSNLPYDPVNDFEPVTQVASVPSVLLVHRSLNVNTVAELIALARANPGQLTFGSAGSGTAPHLAGELLKSLAKVDLVHVPYKGGGHSATDLAAGRLSLMIENVPVALSLLRGGQVKGIAVSTQRRMLVLPELPPIADTLPGYDLTNWLGVLAPAGTPAEVIARLNFELVGILETPEMKRRMAERGADPIGDSPGEFAAHIRREITHWGNVVRALNLKVY